MRIYRLCILVLPLLSVHAYADPFTLGQATSFAILAGSTLTNAGNSIVDGNLGVSPGSAVTGFPPGTVAAPYTIYQGTPDAVAAGAQSEDATAYDDLSGMPSNFNLTGQDLGGLTLTPGVYKFNSSAQLTGILTLNAEGKDDAAWVFQIGSTLMTASASSVNFINLGPSPDDGLFWLVGSSATLGTATAFEGNILAVAGITLSTDATIDCGRAFAESGAVTMDENTVSIGCLTNPQLQGTSGLSGGLVTSPDGGPPSPAPSVPEPGSGALLGSGLIGFAGALRRRLQK